MSERSEKFNVGDIVIRTGADYHPLKQGELYTVRSIESSCVSLIGYGDMLFSRINFELYEDRLQMKNMKFDVAKIARELGVEHATASRIIQEMLFEQGCGWHLSDAKIRRTDGLYLFAYQDSDITYSTTASDFNEKITHKEFTIKPTYTFVEIPEIETVELNGKKYNKQELEEALSMLKPLEN